MKRGPYKNQKHKLEQARRLRLEGHSYRSIGEIIGVNPYTLTKWVQDVVPTTTLKVRHKSGMKRQAKDLPNLRSKTAIRNFMLRLHDKCQGCFLSTWLEKPLVLEVDHIDGNNKNNTIDNLRVLCPNCHSQTPTWKRGKKAL